MNKERKENNNYRLWPEIIKFVRSPLRFLFLLPSLQIVPLCGWQHLSVLMESC